MKVSEFLGTKVLDKNAVEIGKVSDMYFDPKEGIISAITISTGDFGLRKKDLEVEIGEIAELGDYLLLKITKADIDSDD